MCVYTNPDIKRQVNLLALFEGGKERAMFRCSITASYEEHF
jgi:hypothetical protein